MEAPAMALLLGGMKFAHEAPPAHDQRAASLRDTTVSPGPTPNRRTVTLGSLRLQRRSPRPVLTPATQFAKTGAFTGDVADTAAVTGAIGADNAEWKRS